MGQLVGLASDACPGEAAKLRNPNCSCLKGSRSKRAKRRLSSALLFIDGPQSAFTHGEADWERKIFDETIFDCPDIQTPYDYRGALSHDLNYRHEGELATLTIEDATQTALINAEMLSIEVGTFDPPSESPRELRPENVEQEPSSSNSKPHPEDIPRGGILNEIILNFDKMNADC